MDALASELTASEHQLAKYLLESQHLTEQSLDRAAQGKHDSGESLGDVLCRLGILPEAQLVDAYAKILGLQKIEPSRFPIEPLPLAGISGHFLRASRALLIDINTDGIQLAVANPLNDFTKRAIEYVVEKPVHYLVAPASDIDLLLDQKTTTSTHQTKPANDSLDDLDKLRDMASDAPVIKYVNRLLHQAVTSQASDIHIEPMETELMVRLRIDGLLQDIDKPPSALKSAITSRVKIMAGLDIAESRMPQDGRIRIAIQGVDVDFRVSTTPTAFGESIVLRILNQSTLNLDLNSLGFSADEQVVFRNLLEKPQGIILVTGPTGSGKTTTLYTALNILNLRSRKILTVEDPVEYMLAGVNQVQVNNQIGLSFASALRSFLRQDPDIIMVGEIRDYETAQIAMQASLTGHLILSTLHTNTAAGAVVRLLDMGVEDFLLASTVDVVMGQRLVRKLCSNCKKCSEPQDYMPIGCPDCQHTGYQGRTMVVEILQVTPAIKQLIRQGASATQIQEQACKEGMLTISQKAQALVEKGVTSRAEITRVIGRARA
ncbi:ATPase, T2SS/T4P/T4SS family [Porticoccaceae bacterium]|nr:ATPase, T2SS/T4P/T4SS family [Porticoccaceae bacterium]